MIPAIPGLPGQDRQLVLALTLAHFLWQGALGLIVAHTLRTIGKRWTSSVRYTLLVAVFALMALAPLATATFLLRYEIHSSPPTPAQLETLAKSVALQARSRQPAFPTSQPIRQSRRRAIAIPAPTSQPTTLPAPTAQSPTLFSAPLTDHLSTTISIAYALGTTLMLLRLLIGYSGGRKLHKTSTPLTNRAVLGIIGQQAQNLGLSVTPAVAVCAQISVPCIVGILRPVLLMPPDFVISLARQQLTWIIRHELGHIRRWDHLVNFLQLLVEALLFFHPAVWLVSRMIRAEREYCCDDLALGEDPTQRKQYGLMLIDFAQRLSTHLSPGAPLASVSSVRTVSDAAMRVGRLIRPVDAYRFRLRGAFLASICTLLIATVIATQLQPALASTDRRAGPLASIDGRVLSIHRVAVDGAPESLIALVAAGTDVNARNTEGWTPLHLAAAAGRTDQVKTLLDLGADASLPNGVSNRTALQLAIGVGAAPLLRTGGPHLDLIELLARAPGGLAPDRSGRSPLQLACQLRHLPTIKLLLDIGPANTFDSLNQSPLHFASHMADSDAILLLLDAGLDPNVQTDRGDTPLSQFAANWRDNGVAEEAAQRVVESFLRHGAKMSPAIAACTHQTRWLEDFLTANPDQVNLSPKQAKQSLTLLHRAAKSGDLDICRLLLKFHADLMAKDTDGNTPLDIALEGDQQGDVFELLYAATATATGHKPALTPYAYAIAANRANAKIVRSLIRHGVPYDTRFDLGSTPLHQVLMNYGALDSDRRCETVIALIEAGAPLDLKDHDGATPLINAVRLPDAHAVLLLLEKNASPTLADKVGRSPLHFAAQLPEQAALEIIPILLAHGACVDQKDSHGRLPLDLCPLSHSRLRALLKPR